MPPLSRAEFTTAVGRLPANAFVSFVAALYRARGWQTAVRDSVVSLERDGDSRAIYVMTSRTRLSPRTVPASADVVVTRQPRRLPDGLEATVVDSDALYELLRYGVDRRAAADLCGRFLDRPTGGTPSPRSRKRTIASSAFALVLVVLVALVVTGTPSTADQSDVGSLVETADELPPSDGAQGESSTLGPETLLGWEAAVAAASPVSEGPTARLAPGVTTRGVDDVDALASAHVDAIRPRSYRWSLTYAEYSRVDQGLSLDGRRSETIRVAEPTLYRTDVSGWGDLAMAPSPVSTVPMYADGSHRFVRMRSENATTYARYPAEVSSDGTRFESRAAQYIRWYLSAERTAVVGTVKRNGEPRYRVTAEGSDYPPIDEFHAIAIVDADGVVHDLRVSYTLPERNVVVAVELRYAFERQTFDPPPWYDEARDAARPHYADDPVNGTTPT